MNKLENFDSLDEFNIINDNLGKGYSSKVSLIEHKITKKKFALKSVNRYKIIYFFLLFNKRRFINDSFVFVI